MDQHPLDRALAKRPAARKLFAAMPPSHQREYYRYIDEAKLSATRERRARNAIEQILAKPQSQTSGYSLTPLVKKLGISQAGINIVIHEPPGLLEALDLDKTVVLKRRLLPGANFVWAFYTSSRRLRSDFDSLKRSLRKDGMLWISWPKQSSPVESDLSDNSVRQIGLDHGLVDVKVAAIDSDWSGIKFVYRLSDR